MHPQKRARHEEDRHSRDHRSHRDSDRHRHGSRHRSRSRDRKEGSSRHSRPTATELEEGEIDTLDYDDPPSSKRSRDDRSPPRYSDRESRRAEPSARHSRGPSPPRAPRADRERRAPAPSKAAEKAPDSNLMAPAIPSTSDRQVEPAEAVPERDPAEILEERRRARAAIMAKYAAGGTGSNGASAAASPLPNRTRENTPSGAVNGVNALNSPAARLTVDSPKLGSTAGSARGTDSAPPSRSVSPEAVEQNAFDLEKAAGEASPAPSRDHGVSAADYNPNADRLLDERRQMEKEGHIAGATNLGVAAVAEDEDDLDDMFAIADSNAEADDTVASRPPIDVEAAPAVLPVIDRNDGGQIDQYDDTEGYYRVILGELLDSGRYHVTANLGKGMFSSVVRCRDTHSDKPNHEIAIKIQRSQETMYKAGQKEALVLRRLCEADPLDKKHIVRLERVFEHRGHLCLVFENLSLNLREIVKRFGKDVGINLRAVRAYAHQMFLALSLMRKLDIIHADIKPDNILVNESKSQLKVCDLGSASDSSEAAITPYLVSRFYRAPEIILGLPYDCSIDTWAIGCTLYELYTGKILFAGRNNNQMLLEHQELRGRLTARSLKKAKFTDTHFDETGNFLSQERNKLTGQEEIKRLAISIKPVADLRSRLMQPSHLKRLSDDEVKLLTNFVDLLNRCLELDATKRILPREALAVRAARFFHY